MPPIAPETIYSKTAKGILEVKNKTVKLPRELGLIFLSVDGKASVADLQPRSGMSPAQLQHALTALVTDGYIKTVSQGGTQVAVDKDNVDFTQRQAIATVNAEAASHALAAADAAKRAQAEAKAALEARLRGEAEARARALAETRAAAEAEARAKAEESARAAAEERAKAEREAGSTTDPAARAEAEARARSAAAAVVRAEAEARVRAEAEERARAQAEEKRAAEEEAARESEARSKAGDQAQARAAAEGRVKELLEAQLQAMESLRAGGDPNAPEAEVARARVRQIENEAERAREAAREIDAAEGRANEVPQPEMDIAERVRQLHARVAAQRKEHEAPKPDPLDVKFEPDPQLAGAPTISATTVPAEKPPDDLPMVVIPSDDEPMVRMSVEEAASPAPAESTALPVVNLDGVEGAPGLPVVDLDRATGAPSSAMAGHVPTALERAMAEMAARQQARQEQQEPPPEKPKPDPASKTQPIVFEVPKEVDGAPKVEPTIDDDEPIAERLNIDRTSHDLIAESIETRRKAEAAQFSHDAVEARRKRAEEEARRSAVSDQQRKRRKLLQGAVIVAVALPVLGVLWLQFATLNGYIPAAQRAISQRLNQPVTIQNLRYVLLPTPRLTLDDIWIGKGQGVKVKRLQARVQPFAALAGPETFDLVEAEGVEIDPAIFATIPKWTGGQPADTIRVNNLRIADLKLNMPGESLGTFNGTVVFAANGTVKDAAFENDKVRLVLTPSPEGVRVGLDATGWHIPYGPPVTFDRLKLSGLIDEKQVAAGEFTGTLASGNVEGAITARWAGPVSVQGEFKLQNARLLDLTRELTPNFAGRGTLRANGRFSMQGADWSSVRANPQVESAFSISRGELTGIDLVRAIQSAAPGAIRGGRTAFEDLSGIMQLAGERVAFRQLQMTSGALNVSGTVDVSAQGQLSGRFNAQLASGGGSVVARSSLGVTGTVSDPNLTR